MKEGKKRGLDFFFLSGNFKIKIVLVLGNHRFLSISKMVFF